MANVTPMKEPGNLFAPSKSCEKHLSKNDILGKGSGHWPASLLKTSFIYSCFLHFLSANQITGFFTNWFKRNNRHNRVQYVMLFFAFRKKMIMVLAVFLF